MASCNHTWLGRQILEPLKQSYRFGPPSPPSRIDEQGCGEQSGGGPAEEFSGGRVVKWGWGVNQVVEQGVVQLTSGGAAAEMLSGEGAE